MAGDPEAKPGPEDVEKEESKMRMTPQEMARLREILGERGQLSEVLAQMEVQKGDIVRRISNSFEDQKRFMDKLGGRLGLRDGQFNVNADTGEITPGRQVMMGGPPGQ